MVCESRKMLEHHLIGIAEAFGFLGGKEVKEKGLTNVGLHDRRFSVLLLVPWIVSLSNVRRTIRSQVGPTKYC